MGQRGVFFSYFREMDEGPEVCTFIKSMRDDIGKNLHMQQYDKLCMYFWFTGDGSRIPRKVKILIKHLTESKLKMQQYDIKLLHTLNEVHPLSIIPTIHENRMDGNIRDKQQGAYPIQVRTNGDSSRKKKEPTIEKNRLEIYINITLFI